MKQELLDKKKRMVDYLNMCVKEEDWHGVQDAASDIREIEAQINIVQEKKPLRYFIPHGADLLKMSASDFIKLQQDWNENCEPPQLRHVSLP